MASENDTTDCNAEVTGKMQVEDEQVYTENDKRTTKITSDSECKPLTKEIPANYPDEDASKTKNDLDIELYSRTTNRSGSEQSSLTQCVSNVEESSDLEIPLQIEMKNTIPRTKEGIDKENFCRSEEILEMDLAELQRNPSLQECQISCTDIRNTADGRDNTSKDKDSTSRSVSIDLSDRVEHIHEYEDRDIELEGDACRICHCGNESEILISPCVCTGTVKYVHHSCLMDWLKRCVKTKCELCLHNFSVHRKTKPLKKWRRPDQKPTPIIWLLTFVVALTLNIASIAKDGSQKCVSNPCIIFYVVGALGAMLGFAFFYHWLIVSIRYIKQWMALNEEWTLVGSDNTKIKGEENLAASNKSIETKDQRTEVQVV